MITKTYTADTMPEVMDLVARDLGKEAVILQTRHYRKGRFLGLFGGKRMVEVMAAIDSPLSSIVKTASPKAESIPELFGLHNEISNMKKMLEQAVDKIEKQAPAVDTKEDTLISFLEKYDIDKKIAEDLIKGLPNVKNLLTPNSPKFKELLFERVVNYLKRADGITLIPGRCKVVAFLGPTGVGKTTTIAKLAAKFSIESHAKVAMITADTYRIAAVEQLKTYGDILQIPVEVVYSPSDLKLALEKHADKDIVLVDTAGRSPKNKEQIDELKAMLKICPEMEKHLVLSLTTRYKDCVEIVKQFSVCNPEKFIFTKVDEATSYGTILNLLCKFPLSVSYIATGQNVPDDFEEAQPEKLATMILS